MMIFVDRNMLCWRPQSIHIRVYWICVHAFYCPDWRKNFRESVLPSRLIYWILYMLCCPGWCTASVRRPQSMDFTWQRNTCRVCTNGPESSARQRRGSSRTRFRGNFPLGRAVQTDASGHNYKESHWRLEAEAWGPADFLNHNIF
jgi:hypothetical protein